jgi:hypothetical protein
LYLKLATDSPKGWFSRVQSLGINDVSGFYVSREFYNYSLMFAINCTLLYR